MGVTSKKNNTSKKGFIYTVDAIIFVIIVSAAILILPTETSIPRAAENSAVIVSQDIVTILSELQLNELNATWASEQELSGTISDTQTTVLRQITEFWAKGEFELAYNLTIMAFNDIPTPHLGMGLWINNELIYTQGNSPKGLYTAGWKVVSGIEKNKPTRGFISSAQAKNVIKNSTLFISLSPQGAGWDAGIVDITKYFNLSDIEILSAEMIYSKHSDHNNNDVRVNFNSGLCDYGRDDFSWEFATEGNIGIADVTACIVNSTNTATLRLNNHYYNAHLHPGTVIRVEYRKNETLRFLQKEETQRVYLENIYSEERSNDHSGAWTSVPFFIPESAQNISVRAQIVGNNIRDYTGNAWFRAWHGGWERRRNFDYTLFLNDNTPIDVDSSPSANPTYRYNNSFLSPHIQTGTNVLSLYFNNYGDYVWGDGWTQLYSNPFIDPQGSSFIEINYTNSNTLPYGLIAVSDIIPFTGSNDHDKTESFSYPQEAIQKKETFIHIAQQYSDEVTIWADTFTPPSTEIFDTPSQRAIPTTTYVDPVHFGISPLVDNYIRVRDDGSGNEIIVDYSSIENTFYVPAYVGYGDVFETEEEARNDSIQRLKNATGEYLSVENLEVDSQTVTDVPTLYGPAIIEVRVWN